MQAREGCAECLRTYSSTMDLRNCYHFGDLLLVLYSLATRGVILSRAVLSNLVVGPDATILLANGIRMMPGCFLRQSEDAIR